LKIIIRIKIKRLVRQSYSLNNYVGGAAPAAKAVLTSIINSLGVTQGLGWFIDGTS
jgi:polysaccharide deacetylase 2 family uncharacterized protein YibQ